MQQTHTQIYANVEAQIEASATYFQNMYLDWWNNFVTLEGFARYHGMTLEKANNVIKTGRKVHNTRTGNTTQIIA